MTKAKQRKGIRTAAYTLLSLLFFWLTPLTVSGAEVVSLAVMQKGLTYPIDLAVSPAGKIYVADGLSKKILIYNSEYHLTGSIGAVQNPTAVAVSADGTLYAADNKSRTVKIFNAAGTMTGELQNGPNAATFKLPRNITIDGNGNVYVVDQFADSIEKFDANGNHQQFTLPVGSLSMPQDAVVVGNEIFVTDQPYTSATTATGTTDGSTSSDSMIRVSRVQIFDLDGNKVTAANRQFPVYGNKKENGEYLSLKGLAVDSNNILYLNDSYLNVVYAYNTNGEFQEIVTDALSTPLGSTVSADGRLFITSSYDGKVLVFGVNRTTGANTWANDTPVADAGGNQNVKEGAEFTLDGSASSDSDGTVASYQWFQKSGAPLFAVNPFTTADAQTGVIAPNVGPEGAIFIFELVVADNKNKQSAPVSTKVIVENSISGSLVINDGSLYTNDPQVGLSLDAPEAVQMRFSNEDGPFSGYYPYTAAGQWTLSGGDGTKTVNVEFKDGGNNTTTALGKITLDTLAPDSPDLIDVGSAGGEFNWQPVDGAVKYVLQYAANSQFTGAVSMEVSFNGLTTSLEGLASGLWYWRVQSVDAAGNISEWSDAETFRIGPDCTLTPDTPQLAQPYNGAEDISRTAFLETEDMIYPAECGEHLRTEWQVGTRADFSDGLVLHVGTTLDNLTGFQVPALVLEPATKYYWRVKQVTTNGEASAWSNGWSFTTAADYDQKGEDGVLYVQPEGEPDDASGEEIAISEVVGDAGVKIKAIRVSSGVVTKTIQDIDPNSIPDTVNKPSSFPLGLLSIKLDVLEPGAFVQIKVLFSKAVPKGAEWYSYNTESGWHAYEGAVFSRNRKSVTLNFQDGGLGDTDGLANGTIVNP
jgi:hypothetical protein